MDDFGKGCMWGCGCVFGLLAALFILNFVLGGIFSALLAG